MTFNIIIDIFLIAFGFVIILLAIFAWFKEQGKQKSIWHNEYEEPQRGSLILLIMQSGTPIVAKIIEPNHTFNHGERWAYIDDLLEKQGQVKESLISQHENKTCKENDDSLTNDDEKIEPKFKIGDFLVNDYCMGKVIELTNDAYLLDTGQGIPFSCEHNVHLWAIQDAKDGDVLLSSDGSIFIFKEVVDFGCKHYIALATDGTIQVNDNFTHFWESISGVCPTTKEQRDLLFAKMKEAGYKWNAEEKELKLLITNGGDFCSELENHEQEPAEWSEEDEKEFEKIIDHFDWNSDNLFSHTDCDRAQVWLKSIKQRIGG